MVVSAERYCWACVRGYGGGGSAMVVAVCAWVSGHKRCGAVVLAVDWALRIVDLKLGSGCGWVCVFCVRMCVVWFLGAEIVVFVVVGLVTEVAGGFGDGHK